MATNSGRASPFTKREITSSREKGPTEAVGLFLFQVDLAKEKRLSASTDWPLTISREKGHPKRLGSFYFTKMWGNWPN